MKKILLGLIILIISIGFTGCINTNIKKDDALIITLDKLLKDYINTPIIAQEKYEGNKLQIKANLYSVNKLKNGNISLDIYEKQGIDEAIYITANLDKKSLTKDVLSNLKSGDSIVIQGTYTKETDFEIGILNNSKIIKE